MLPAKLRLVTLGTLTILFVSSTLGQTLETHGTDGALTVGKQQPALLTSINGPSDVAYSNGHLYLIETAGMRILSLDVRRETATLILAPPIDPYTKDNDRLGSPFAIAVSQTGEIFVADVGGKLAQVNLNTHSASIKRTGLLDKFPQVHAMSADPRNGTILLTDRHALLRWTPRTNELTKLAGSSTRPGFSGDGGQAMGATFNWPQGLAIDIQGNVFVADTENCRLRRIDAESGIITTVAGGTKCDSTGDGRPAKTALLRNPRAMAVDSYGNVFLSEGCRVRRIDSDGTITTYAGTSDCGFSGDDGPATKAMINADGLAVDKDGNLYIADYSHNRIRRVEAGTHRISTFAGNGLPHRVDVQL
jgi:sugar lactone lactonase YvrE